LRGPPGQPSISHKSSAGQRDFREFLLHYLRFIAFGLATAALPAFASGQLPLAPLAKTGQTVTPVFEGWYRNADGTFSLSFGYYNRNTAESIDIPIGADNVISPGDANQGQPTRFETRRHWGVFAVKVPATFDTSTVTWTLRVQGETFAIPGRLHPDWQIDALAGEAGSGNTPPVVRLSSGGPAAQGPAGATAGPLTATVGQPLSLTVWATDDGRGAGSVVGSGRSQVALMWFKHQGPGNVAFSVASPKPDSAAGMATTTATFAQPGAYVLRVRANDSGVAGAGHAQCCWTNGFIRVTVRP
jgi:hypothetical protein